MILKISIDEIHSILREIHLDTFEKNPSITYPLKKVENHFEMYKLEILNTDEQVLFTQDELLNLLNAPLGLYENEGLTKKDLTKCEVSTKKYDIELTKEKYWRIK